jgi:hypothetical protein
MCSVDSAVPLGLFYSGEMSGYDATPSRKKREYIGGQSRIRCSAERPQVGSTPSDYLMVIVPFMPLSARSGTDQV